MTEQERSRFPDAPSTALAIVTSAFHWETFGDSSGYLTDIVGLLSGKSGEELVIIVGALGTLATQLAKMAADETGVSAEELLHAIALGLS